MEFKFKNRYLVEGEHNDVEQLKDKILFFIAEDMNNRLIFQFERGYSHLNLPHYETALIPKGLCTFIDYDQQEHDRRVTRKKKKLENDAEKIQAELAELNAAG